MFRSFSATIVWKLKGLKMRIALRWQISELRGITCHMHHTVLPATRHKWTRPSQAAAVLHSPTPEGWKAELTWVAGYMTRWFTCPQTVTHSSRLTRPRSWPRGALNTKRSLGAVGVGLETTSCCWSWSWRKVDDYDRTRTFSNFAFSVFIAIDDGMRILFSLVLVNHSTLREKS